MTKRYKYRHENLTRLDLYPKDVEVPFDGWVELDHELMLMYNRSVHFLQYFEQRVWAAIRAANEGERPNG